MSLADAVAANYKRALTDYGKWIEVRRSIGGDNQTIISIPARARIRSYRVREERLATTVGQNEHTARILFSDLVDGQYPLPVRINDKILIGGIEKTIISVDNETGFVGNQQIFIIVFTKG